MKNNIAPLALLVAFAGAAAQEAAVDFRSTEVAPGIYMLEGDGGFAGGNIGLLTGEDRIVLIDDGLTPLAPKLLAAAGEIAGRSVDFVINTHVHGDHVGGNAALARDGAVIVAHDNIRKRLVDDAASAGGPAGLPTVTFADAVTFHVNGHEAYVFHVENAHTDGDAVIHFRDVDVIHTGDIFFNDVFPFIDLDNGGSLDGYISAQRQILDMADDDTIIIPGHGPVADRTALERANDMLVDARERVKALIVRGLTEEQVLAENPLESYHEDWNWGFITTERMTQTLYRALSGG